MATFSKSCPTCTRAYHYVSLYIHVLRVNLKCFCYLFLNLVVALILRAKAASGQRFWYTNTYGEIKEPERFSHTTSQGLLSAVHLQQRSD